MRRLTLAPALALLAALLAGPALAETCRATVNDSVFLIDDTELSVEPAEIGRLEAASRWPGALKDRVLGQAPACDSATLIAYLGSRVPEDEIDGYCLAERETGGFLLVPGERNFRGRCATTACEKVDMAKDGAVGLAQDMTGLGKDDAEEGEEKGVIEHVSGAVMLTGTVSAVGSQLATIGSGAVAAVGALPAAAAAAATVVVVGGAVYVCS